MRKIDYYIAISIDGYICGPEEDISGFVQGGNGIEQYLEDLKTYDTVLMGRKTYEFGYKYGLEPGQLAYPHMKHYVFSEQLTFENKDDNLNVCPLDINVIEQLKKEVGTNIYLCGGGELANWLLGHKAIDRLKVKLNPFIQGAGTKLFGEFSDTYQLQLEDTAAYENGLMILTYQVIY